MDGVINISGLPLLRRHDAEVRDPDRASQRFARLVDVLEAQPPRIAVDLTALSPAGEAGGAESLEEADPRTQAALVAALRTGEESRVVEETALVVIDGV